MTVSLRSTAVGTLADDAPQVQFRRRNAFARMPVRSRIALVLVLVVITLSFAAPLLPLQNPIAGELPDRLLGFGAKGHLFGTDALGRDIFSRLVYATRTSLIASIVPILLATVLGLAIGMTAGLTRSSVLRTILMRAVDILFAFPGVVLALLLTIALGAGLESLIIAVTMVWIPPIARIAETEVVRVRELDFVNVALASGATYPAVLLRQILPVSLPAVVAYSTSLVGACIAIVGGMGFIGLGVPSPEPELGSMLQELQGLIYGSPLQSLLPVIIIILLSTLFPLIGDGIRDAINGREGDA